MKYLLNPLSKDIETQYDGYGPIVLKADSITSFKEDHIFNHALTLLIDCVLNERNLWHIDANREDIKKEVIKDKISG